MSVDDRRRSASDCTLIDKASSLINTDNNINIRQGQYKDLFNNSLSSNHVLVAGNSNIPDSGNGASSLNFLNQLQSGNSILQGALVIKENSNPIPKTNYFVEGKGKGIIQLEISITPKKLKLSSSTLDSNTSSSGKKIFVNHFVNSNAIPGLRRSNCLPSIEVNSAPECSNKNFLKAPNQIEIHNSGDAESMSIANSENSALVTEIRIPEGNLEEDQENTNPVFHSNKFSLLNALLDEGKADIPLNNQKVENLEEGEILDKKDECHEITVADSILCNNGDKAVSVNFKSNSKGSLHSQKIKLAKEMKFLGPLSSSSRMTRNNSIKTKSGGISPFKSK
ncbi:hypothetical protein MA16_Dca016284 [Dendrobium catenatum]|uniref:Uncharacterized protein n=1 Tax=Dendrobium catenatum TaxID=906689 RepID=A0A2I0X607_9ASPA|nr:hypothetical protein MA16_Dca016284 [Dendrobium catenatum]